MPRVYWTPNSRNDLQVIREYISRDSPRIARMFLNKLVKSVRKLGRFPELGQVVKWDQADDVRQIAFGKYRVIYRLISGRVEILTIAHAARLLGGDDAK